MQSHQIVIDCPADHGRRSRKTPTAGPSGAGAHINTVRSAQHQQAKQSTNNNSPHRQITVSAYMRQAAITPCERVRKKFAVRMQVSGDGYDSTQAANAAINQWPAWYLTTVSSKTVYRNRAKTVVKGLMADQKVSQSLKPQARGRGGQRGRGNDKRVGDDLGVTCRVRQIIHRSIWHAR